MLLKWLVVTNVPAGNVWNWTIQPRLVVKLGRLILLSINFIQLLLWTLLPNFTNINQLDWRYFTNIRSESELTLPHLLYWLYLYWIMCNIYKETININFIFYHETSNNSTSSRLPILMRFGVFLKGNSKVL